MAFCSFPSPAARKLADQAQDFSVTAQSFQEFGGFFLPYLVGVLWWVCLFWFCLFFLFCDSTEGKRELYLKGFSLDRKSMVFLILSSNNFTTDTLPSIHWTSLQILSPHYFEVPRGKLFNLIFHTLQSYSCHSLESNRTNQFTLWWNTEREQAAHPNTDRTLQSTASAVTPWAVCSGNGAYVLLRHLEFRWLSTPAVYRLGI